MQIPRWLGKWFGIPAPVEEQQAEPTTAPRRLDHIREKARRSPDPRKRQELRYNVIFSDELRELPDDTAIKLYAWAAGGVAYKLYNRPYGEDINLVRAYAAYVVTEDEVARRGYVTFPLGEFFDGGVPKQVGARRDPDDPIVLHAFEHGGLPVWRERYSVFTTKILAEQE